MGCEVTVEVVVEGELVEVADVDSDVVVDVDADVAGAELVVTKVESTTCRSNGGLYSKVFVKSSIILKPYLSPFVMVLLS